MARADPSPLSTAMVHREIQHLRELLEYRLNGLDHRITQRAEEQHQALVVASEVQKAQTDEVQASIARRVESLIHLIDERVDGAAKVTEVRFDTFQIALRETVSLTDSKFVTHQSLLDSQTQKTELALSASDKAISKAETFNEKRFENQALAVANLIEQSKNYVIRQEFDTLRTNTAEKIDDLKSYQAATIGRASAAPNTEARVNDLMAEIASLRDYRSTTTGKSQGLNAGWGLIVGAVGLFATIITIVVAFSRAV